MRRVSRNETESSRCFEMLVSLKTGYNGSCRRLPRWLRWDPASDVWRAVPRETFTNETVEVRKELVDRLLQSAVGSAEAAGRDFLQPVPSKKSSAAINLHSAD